MFQDPTPPKPPVGMKCLTVVLPSWNNSRPGTRKVTAFSMDLKALMLILKQGEAMHMLTTKQGSTMVAIARKTNHNDMSFIMLAGRYTNIIASFYAYIYSSCFTESDISGSNGAGFQHVVIILSPSVPWTNLFLKGPDSMTHACPKLFYFFCVCGTSDMSSTCIFF